LQSIDHKIKQKGHGINGKADIIFFAVTQSDLIIKACNTKLQKSFFLATFL